MTENIKKIGNCIEIPDNYKYYWKYQYRLGYESLIPYLKELSAFSPDTDIVEIGSAEGGVVCAMKAFGAGKCLCTDIAENRLEMGKRISSILELDIEYKYHNILENEIPDEWRGRFDLALLRDVIEHLENPETALRAVKALIKPGGYLFVTFPPYHSPFGGHQHTVANFWGKAPYIHLLPKEIFANLISSGRKEDIGEVMRLRNIRLTADNFFDAAKNAGYSVAREEYYLLRPVFKMKFGLPELKLTKIKDLPLVKKYFALECAALLKA